MSTKQKAVPDVSSEIEEVLHDIKAPLSAIMAGLDLLDTQGLSAAGRDEVKRSLKLSAHCVVEMIETLSHSRSLSKNSFAFVKEPLQLDTLLGDIYQEYSPLFITKGIKLKPANARPGLMIEADPRGIKRVFSNLLSNALRSLTAGCSVAINIAHRSEVLVITVTDDGPGFDTRAVGQSTGFTRCAGGSGLGLSICQRIVKAHGGSLHIRSVVGRGTSVAIVLPYQG